MQPGKSWVCMLVALALPFTPGGVLAQVPFNYVELRGAVYEDGFYRYAEYARVFSNRVVIDVVYFGIPEQNEIYVGSGYQFGAAPSLFITPLFYVVAGKENAERGVALGTFVLGTVHNWNVYSFLGYFEPIEGSVPRYLFLDSGDISRRINSWEVGVSTGFLYASGASSFLLGPVLVWNDRRGGWRFYLRGGTTVEARLARTLSF